MILVVNNVDMMPYVIDGGITWAQKDIKGPNETITQDSRQWIDLIGRKSSISVICRPLTLSESQIVLNAIYPEYVTVRITDARQGVIDCEMFSDNVPETNVKNINGVDYWMGISYTLAMR